MLTDGGGSILGPALFAGLEQSAALLLAVSGGPDSMAMMSLAARWASGLGDRAPRLLVATVDHGLRAEAAAEASLVASSARALGLPHATLPWSAPRPATRVQERARQARYALLAAEATRVGASAVLVAHHADDQAETVLMRLGRGSGIGGLAGMRRESALTPGIALVRPFLGVPKTNLVAFCEREHVAFVTDPSNLDPAYARARLRQKAETLEAIGLDRDALVRLAERMARAEDALEAEARRIEDTLVATRTDVLYNARLPTGLAPELLLRLLRIAVRHVAPRSAMRLDRLEAASQAVGAALARGKGHRATLAGTRIAVKGDGTIDIVPERVRRRGRTPPPAAMEGPRRLAVKAELTRAPASLGKSEGSAYIV